MNILFTKLFFLHLQQIYIRPNRENWNSNSCKPILSWKPSVTPKP